MEVMTRFQVLMGQGTHDTMKHEKKKKKQTFLSVLIKMKRWDGLKLVELLCPRHTLTHARETLLISPTEENALRPKCSKVLRALETKNQKRKLNFYPH